MTLTLSLPPDEQKKLTERAAAAGQDVVQYVHDLIKRDIETPSIMEAAKPITRAIVDSGISDQEFEQFVEQSRQEIWEERSSRLGGTP